MSCSNKYEKAVRLLRSRPRLAAELLQRALKGPLPAYAEPILADDQSGVGPAEYRPDTLILLPREGAESGYVAAIVLEALPGIDPGRALLWPVCFSLLRARYDCPVYVLVLTMEEHVAEWCREPIVLEPGSAEYRVVIVLPSLSERAIERWLGIGIYRYQSELARRNHAIGYAHCLVLGTLKARGLSVSDKDERRIRACKDPLDLIDWVYRAPLVKFVDDLF